MGNVWQPLITLASLVVAMATIYYSNKNSRRQTKIGKLEELYQSIQQLDRFYAIFMPLWFKIQQYRDPEDKSLSSLTDYYNERDVLLNKDERERVAVLLSKLEVLSACYTSGFLRDKISSYDILMSTFFELVSNGGSIYQEVHFKSGFPGYDEFYKMSKEVKECVVQVIRK